MAASRVEQADIPDGDPEEWDPEQKRRVLEAAAELDLPDGFTDFAAKLAQSVEEVEES
jgi:hypothetical protein